MILAGYAALGLLAEDFNDIDDLNIATFNDFLNTRFYGSKYVTEFYQMLILYIWSLEPDESSVVACQRFFQFQFRQPTPTAWVLNSGDAYTSVIQPIVKHLQTKFQVTFQFDTPVVAASLNAEKNLVEHVMIIENYSESYRCKVIPTTTNNSSAHYFVFAVPPETLSALVQTPIPSNYDHGKSIVDSQIILGSNRYGLITDIMFDVFSASSSEDVYEEVFSSEMLSSQTDGVTLLEGASSADCDAEPALAAPLPLRAAIVEAIPELATTKTLSAEPIPVLYLAFKQGAKINHLIPQNCYVGLTESKYALTLVEITHEFKSANPQFLSSEPAIGTIIALASSDFGELPIFRTPPKNLDRQAVNSTASTEAQSLEDKSIDLLLQEAKKYLPFQDSDILWSFFRTNVNHRLFLNDVDSARNPVKTVYRLQANSNPIISNLVFAGDYCSQDVIMATVEAAVESGLRAGMEVYASYGQHPRSSSVAANNIHRADHTPLTLQAHRAYPKPLITYLKLALTPYAMLAKSYSDLNIIAEEMHQIKSEPSRIESELLPQLLSYWPRQASMCLGAYQDTLNTMTSMATKSVISSSQMFWSLFNLR